MKTTIGEIMDNVPIPPASSVLRGELTVALCEMKPGHCRDFSNGDTRNLTTNLLNIAKRRGMKVTTRKLNGEGVRVWRIK